MGRQSIDLNKKHHHRHRAYRQLEEETRRWHGPWRRGEGVKGGTLIKGLNIYVNAKNIYKVNISQLAAF